jgi:hypothetical protein
MAGTRKAQSRSGVAKVGVLEQEKPSALVRFKRAARRMLGSVLVGVQIIVHWHPLRTKRTGPTRTPSLSFRPTRWKDTSTPRGCRCSGPLRRRFWMQLDGRRLGRCTKTCAGGSGRGGSSNSDAHQPTVRSLHQTTRPDHPLLLTDFDAVPEILLDRPALMLPNPDLLQVERADLRYLTRIDDGDKFRQLVEKYALDTQRLRRRAFGGCSNSNNKSFSTTSSSRGLRRRTVPAGPSGVDRLDAEDEPVLAA